jgi:RNA polymerase sigma-70 factor (ECF subfamily)
VQDGAVRVPGRPRDPPRRFVGRPDRFLGTDHDRWPRHWATPPARWEDSPDRHLESAETVARVRAAIARLPPAQRLVITLRDIEGWHTRKCVTR